MGFESPACTLQWNQNMLALKRGDSVLVINAENVTTLRTLKEQAEFETFFNANALQNREARRLFQAWTRKDKELLSKVFQEMIS